jgi:hypothetical protein
MVLKVFAFLAGLLLASSAHAQEATWAAAEQECQDRIMAEQCPVGHNCYQLWKAIARCTVLSLNPKTPQFALIRCIQQVDTERQRARLCTGCGDPIADIFACLSE